MKDRYTLYWLMPDGTRLYHIDTAFGTPWVYDTYEQLWQVAQRLSKPRIDAKICFDVV